MMVETGGSVEKARAKRFEYVGWALFLLGAVAVAVLRPGEQGLYWLLAGAAMLVYVIAGFMLKFRASFSLLFLAVACLGYGALRVSGIQAPGWAPWALAGAAVLLAMAVRGPGRRSA